MSDFLSTKIMEVMRIHNLGRENAEPRAKIEARIQNFNDRGVRSAYSEIPLCSCEDGLFLPIRPEEVDEYEVYLRRKKMSEDLISIKIRRIRATWPFLRTRPKNVQIPLFPQPEVWR